jgi:hypothetical protein
LSVVFATNDGEIGTPAGGPGEYEICFYFRRGDVAADPTHFSLSTDEHDGSSLLAIANPAVKFRISATLSGSTRRIARVKSYGDELEEYEFHPEAKCADADAAPCGKQTVGLLQRRHVTIESVSFIGKESNKLEEVEEGSVPDAGHVYTEYPNPRRDEWETKWLPMLRSTPVPQLLAQGISQATIYAVRAGRPLYQRTKAKLILILQRL